MRLIEGHFRTFYVVRMHRETRRRTSTTSRALLVRYFHCIRLDGTIVIHRGWQGTCSAAVKDHVRIHAGIPRPATQKLRRYNRSGDKHLFASTILVVQCDLSIRTSRKWIIPAAQAGRLKSKSALSGTWSWSVSMRGPMATGSCRFRKMYFKSSLS